MTIANRQITAAAISIEAWTAMKRAPEPIARLTPCQSMSSLLGCLRPVTSPLSSSDIVERTLPIARIIPCGQPR